MKAKESWKNGKVKSGRQIHSNRWAKHKKQRKTTTDHDQSLTSNSPITGAKMMEMVEMYERQSVVLLFKRINDYRENSTKCMN